MAISLESNPKFIKDFNKLREEISQITDDNLKTELESHLKNLIFEVKKLDIMHGELSMHNALPKGVSDSRSKIQEIRKKIEKKLISIRKTHS